MTAHDPASAPSTAPGHDPSVIAYVRDPDMARGYDDYHTYNRLFETDTRFLAEVLPDPLSDKRRRVLDLGCGTGRHLAYLAVRGYDVTGLDLSPHMLREAAKKLERQGLEARLVRGDMCRLDEVVGETKEFADFSELSRAEEEFDAAICMFSTLGLVRGRRLRRKALAGVWRLLKPEGTLVVHAHNLWNNLTDSWGRSWLAISLLASPVSRLWGCEFGDKWMPGYRGLDRLYLHVFSLREMRKLVESAGFRIERELLLNEARTGPFEGRLAYLRANGFLIAARKVRTTGRSDDAARKVRTTGRSDNAARKVGTAESPDDEAWTGRPETDC